MTPPAPHGDHRPEDRVATTPTSISTPPSTCCWSTNPSIRSRAASTRSRIAAPPRARRSERARYGPRRTRSCAADRCPSTPQAPELARRVSGFLRRRHTHGARQGIPKRASSLSASSGRSQPSPRPNAAAIAAAASSSRTSSNRGTDPSGRARHVPYRAARASAIAACSGYRYDGMRAPGDRNTSGSPRADMKHDSTGMRPSTSPIARTRCRATSASRLERRDEDHDQRVDARVAGDGPDRPAVILRGGRRDHVDRVRQGRRRGKERAEFRHHGVAQPREDETVRPRTCRRRGSPGHRRWSRWRRGCPAGTGWSASSVATSNSSSSVSVRITPACRNSASTVDVGCRQERPRVRHGRPAAGGAPPALDRDDRLRLPTRRASDANRRGFPNDSRYSSTTSVCWILLPVAEQVVAGDVGLVADRDERREPQTEPAACPITARPRAPLCERKPTRPAGGQVGRERRVQPDVGVGVHDPHAVRTDQAHAGRAADLQQLALERSALVARSRRTRPRSPRVRVRPSRRTPGRPRARAPPERR